ncbi:MAG TPA: DUF5662 family protein [Chloroflexota bacterium]|jgi:hypothetical protein
MAIHWQYLRYVVRHKWYVLVYGWRLGIPWLALLHDNSKFLPSEWFAYAHFFYGRPPRVWRDVSAGEKYERLEAAWRESEEGRKEAFRAAWLHHQNRNKHHWQYWLLVNDQEPPRILPMPDRYRREMLADWRGAGRAINGIEDALGWYRQNRDKMQLHPDTRAWVEAELGYVAKAVAVAATS